jgi:glycosyltransferase involved in cell wall biosynthesis
VGARQIDINPRGGASRACEAAESVKVVAVVLTLNEAKHLPRCLGSLEGVVDQVLIADSFSTDATLRIADAHGARVAQHPFITQATQFNWALTQLDPDTEWVLRIDADEYLTPALARELRERLPGLERDIHGVTCGLRRTFQGRLVRYGGLATVRMLRLFRYGHGRCETRWMDEHIEVQGATVDFEGELIDDNLNSLTWWTDKHNRYSSREAVELLNLEYGFMPHNAAAGGHDGTAAGRKRWLKKSVYARLPRGARAFAYFLYRYVIRLGFLDGRGANFHILQGFWYRYLVDAKVAEVKRHMREAGVDAATAIERVLDLRLPQ